MGYVVLAHGVPVTKIELSDKSITQICGGRRSFDPVSPILLESRMEADLLAAFLAMRFPCSGPYSVEETKLVKVFYKSNGEEV